MDLFGESHNDLQDQLDALPHCKIQYIPDFYSLAAAKKLYEELLHKIEWQQDDVKVFGKIYPQPRLTALFSDNSKTYSYSGITMHSKPFLPAINDIKKRIKTNYPEYNFNSCLSNLYRNGDDSNGWHADDEPELGQNPVIASISLGEIRKFRMRLKKDQKIKIDIPLKSGSLLLMSGTTQHYWQHCIPKTKKKVDPRINLTFRFIV